MRRLVVLLSLSFLAFTSGAHSRAQEHADKNPVTPTTIDEVIKAVYGTISGPAGERDWAFFRTLFIEDARLVSMRAGEDGSLQPSVMQVEHYIERAGAFFDQNDFYERELARRTEQFNGIAHCFSTYASYSDPDEPPFSRGINSIQLAMEDGRWKVVTILWDTERDHAQIPLEYLPD